MDIAAWLRGLGLEQYEQAFRDNAIDAEVLPELTDADPRGGFPGDRAGHEIGLVACLTALICPTFPSNAVRSMRQARTFVR